MRSVVYHANLGSPALLYIVQGAGILVGYNRGVLVGSKIAILLGLHTRSLPFLVGYPRTMSVKPQALHG
jgi:hypothetical protein